MSLFLAERTVFLLTWRLREETIATGRGKVRERASDSGL